MPHHDTFVTICIYKRRESKKQVATEVKRQYIWYIVSGDTFPQEYAKIRQKTIATIHIWVVYYSYKA